jgi:alpha-L-rhamnosidase
MTIPTHLRCEYAPNPLGIDALNPRLSWQVPAEGRAVTQAAYQIQAATAMENLGQDIPDLWDTGRIEANDVLVEYAGPLLQSHQRCYWRVRTWLFRAGAAEDAPGPWSEPAWFEMGLLHPQDWQAEWIGFPGAWPGKALYFRRELRVEKPVRRARVYMAGLGWSELLVNGLKVNDRVLDPPQSDYSKRVYYTTDAIEDFLHSGKNTLGVVVGNGWYGTVRLLIQVYIEYEDGSTNAITSKPGVLDTWTVSTGAVLENSVYDGEVFDARLTVNWEKPFAAGASYADGPGGKLVSAAALEPIRVVQTLDARSLSQPRPGIFVFDLGQNIAGWAHLTVLGERGTRISMKYAESLYPDGTVNQENLRNARAEDVYILKGDGVETWEPRFTYHGFRYIQVEGYPGTPQAGAVKGRVVRSSVEPAGSFESSSELLNRIDRMVRWTESSNLHSLPTDCPQRDERMGWLNDMAARSEEALYNYNLARLYSKWIKDIGDEQDPLSGAITDTAPFRWGRRPADPVSVCYLLMPWLLYTHYGDTHTMAERFDGMRAWVDFLTSQAQNHIVGYSWYGDWAPPIAMGLDENVGFSAISKNTPGALVSTACYAYSARLLAKMAAVLGRQPEAEAYSALAESVRAAYNDRFWDETTGGYGSNNQACNAISLYMDLVPQERQERTAASLVHDLVDLNDSHLTTGNICTKYTLEALSATGHAPAALAAALQETYPSWGYMLANGATTLWERWEKATGGGMNSHNHPMLGSVGAWLFRFPAGIQADPQGPGFEHILLRPQILPPLTFVRAALQTLRGTIESAWQVDANRAVYRCTVPTGSQARIFLPWAGRKVFESGVRIWDQGQARDPQAGILEIHAEGDCLVCAIESGKYEFTSEVS